jgi:hypothetical protein
MMNSSSSLKLTILILLSVAAGNCSSDISRWRDKMVLDSADSIKKGAVRVTWMGTAGLYVTDGETGFFIDPFVSRYGLLKVLWGSSLPPRVQTICDWIDRIGCPHADAVIAIFR